MIDGVFEPDEKSLQALILQVDSLARLVEDLRTVTLADSGHLDLRLQSVRLKDEILKLAAVVEQDLKQEGFELKLDLSDVTVQVDPMRIRQALLAPSHQCAPLCVSRPHRHQPGRGKQPGDPACRRRRSRSRP